MNPVKNPFAPGAGSQPPELAGRDSIILDADIAVQRILAGKNSRSQILTGLRGTGKTVLLNKIENDAESHGHITSFIESPEKGNLPSLLYPKIYQVLYKVSKVENAKRYAHKAMRALKGFAAAFKISVGDVSLAVDPEAGIADSGNLEMDICDLFVMVGNAAKAAGKVWTLCIDEMQYLSEAELASLIMAIHRANQKQLPILLFGAGLPQIAALSGNAKSYAERLFSFPSVGPLDRLAAIQAIKNPVEKEGETISEEALEEIVKQTQGYPYFLQEWGYQAWNVADSSPIHLKDIDSASDLALKRLDESFFRVRFDRLTPKEREYVQAMSKLGRGPYRSSEVAEQLGEDVKALGPCRAKIIAKGMIYSPAYGDIAFTVPMFDDYINRLYMNPMKT